MAPIVDKVKDLYAKYREIISYLFFGVLTTLVSWGTYALFVNLGVEINISNILSWILSVLFAFVVNKWFVFMSRSVSVKTVIMELGSFFGARIFTGAIAIILFPILYNLGLNQSLFGTDGFFAKIITSIIEIALNWVFSKYLIFRHKKDKVQAED